MNISTTIPAAHFVELLANNNRDALRRLQSNNTVITGGVRINGKEINLVPHACKTHLQSVDFEKHTFLERVIFEHCDTLHFNASQCNFRSGLSFHNCSGTWVALEKSHMTSFGGYCNRFEVLMFDDIAGEPQAQSDWVTHPSIDISGFTLSERLRLSNMRASELRTLSTRVSGHFTAPAAVVDDPLWILQLRLLGVPVHVPTEAVRIMLQDGTAQRLAQAA